MSEAIDLIVISGLGCACAYLFWKQNKLEKKTSETIPLLKDRETRLEEGERLLREEVLKQVNAKDAFAKIIEQVEADKVTLEKDKASFRAEKSKQEVLGGELTARSKAIEEGEAKLKGDIASFEDKVTAQEKDIQFKTQFLESREKEVESKASAVADDLRSVEEKLDKLAKETESLQKRAEELEAREAALEKAEAELKAKEADEVAVVEDPPSEEPAPEVPPEEPAPEVPPEEPTQEAAPEEDSDAAKRKIMIEEELEKLVKKTNETELPPEDPFDDDSVEALRVAAMKICYVKKYYDVMKDEFIMFPSVAKTALDYRLMEEAEKHYFEEEDEYPADLSGGLRAVAFTIVKEEEDEDFDEEYYTALAQDVEL